ncbi:PmeII family type II restriction endonuclease [Hanstruepera ponticola]|uniref:PmeII family type II restriction endonuclease n=1 Tax=Hanstruepera ponticola TaxID=2042995 RepID=UPI000CF0BCEF|nr:PmeII family type II restriction endonuclease [Hanstruepera ponticola]
MIEIGEVVSYVEENIGTFHQKRIESLNKLKLKNVLKRKNPYLFKAKNVLTSGEIVSGIVDAHVSSNEETIFGDWLEGLAIFINSKVYGGWKSGIEGIDLEFDLEGKRYLVAIKSGPKWSNSTSLKKLKDYYRQASMALRTSNSNINVVSINGCCYGKDNKPDKGEYYKFCGQRFWEFISGNENLYKEIIEPLGYKAKERNDEFVESYNIMINKFTREFSIEFCNDDGIINWEKILELNSKK